MGFDLGFYVIKIIKKDFLETLSKLRRICFDIFGNRIGSKVHMV